MPALKIWSSVARAEGLEFSEETVLNSGSNSLYLSAEEAIIRKIVALLKSTGDHLDEKVRAGLCLVDYRCFGSNSLLV